MADYKIPIRYDEDPQPVDVHVRLTYKGRDADEPIEIQSIESDEVGLLKFTKDGEQSTPEVAVYKAELGDKMLNDNVTFWRHARNPIGFTVKAKPAEGTSRAGSKKPIVIKDRVELKLPPHEIKWYDLRVLPAEENPQVIDVFADGQDEFQLRNVWETWLPTRPKSGPTAFSEPYWDPSTKRGYDPNVVSFSHWTGKRFDPNIFGPHKDDKPWDVAQPGSGNNREKSRWDSKKALPSKQYPDHQVPFTDWVRVKAWGIDRITGRRVNALNIKGRDDHLIEQHINVRLRPPPIRTEILRPGKPVPADGQPHEVELQFIDTKTNKPLKEGEITWELETTGGYPGGSVEPDGVELTEGDGGKTVLNWTPPDLEYRPGAKYDQRLKIFRGRGAHRLTESPVTLWCNPALDLTVSGEKIGTHWRSYDERPLVAAGESPAAVSVHLGANFKDMWKKKKVKAHAFEAAPELSVTSEGRKHSVVTDRRTDEQGRVEVELPEIAKGWQARTDGGDTRPLLRLQEWTEEPGSIEDAACAAVALGQLMGVSRGKPARDLVDASTWQRVFKSGQVQATYLAEWPAAKSCEKAKAIHGTNLVKASIRGAVRIETTQKELRAEGFNEFSRAAWSFLGIALRFGKLGKALAKLPGVGPWLKRNYQRAMTRLVRGMRNLLRSVVGRVRRALISAKVAHAGAGAADDVLKKLTQLLEAAAGGTLEWTGFTDTLWSSVDDLGTEVNDAVAATSSSVAGGAYANEPEAIQRYYTRLGELKKDKPELSLTLEEFSDTLQEIDAAASACTEYGLYAMAAGGATGLAIVAFPVLAPLAGPAAASVTIGGGMLTLGGAGGVAVSVCGLLIYSANALALMLYAIGLGEEFKRLTAEMVKGA